MQNSLNVSAPYRKWTEADDDIYTDIKHVLSVSKWELHHVKGHQTEEQIVQSITARLNNEADMLANEYLTNNEIEHNPQSLKTYRKDDNCHCSGRKSIPAQYEELETSQESPGFLPRKPTLLSSPLMDATTQPATVILMKGGLPMSQREGRSPTSHKKRLCNSRFLGDIGIINLKHDVPVVCKTAIHKGLKQYLTGVHADYTAGEILYSIEQDRSG